jgi:hypothetical protein
MPSGRVKRIESAQGGKDSRSVFQRLLVHLELMPQYVITRARSQDLEQLPHIELAAARLLSGHAPESVLNETTSQDELQLALREGHLWVATRGVAWLKSASYGLTKRSAIPASAAACSRPQRTKLALAAARRSSYQPTASKPRSFTANVDS